MFSGAFKNNVAGTFNVTRLAAGLIGKNSLDANDMRGIVINATGTEGINSSSGRIAMSAASGAIIGTIQSTNEFDFFHVQILKTHFFM